MLADAPTSMKPTPLPSASLASHYFSSIGFHLLQRLLRYFELRVCVWCFPDTSQSTGPTGAVVRSYLGWDLVSTYLILILKVTTESQKLWLLEHLKEANCFSEASRNPEMQTPSPAFCQACLLWLHAGWRYRSSDKGPLASFPNPSRGPAERSAPVYQLMGEKQCQACCKMLSAFPWMQWGWSQQRFSLLDFWKKGSEIQVRPWRLGRAEKRTKRPSGPDLHLQETGVDEQAPFSLGGLWNLECSTWRRQSDCQYSISDKISARTMYHPYYIFRNCIFSLS